MAVRFSCSSLYSQNVLTTKQTQNISRRAKFSPWIDHRVFLLFCLVVGLGWVLFSLFVWGFINFCIYFPPVALGHRGHCKFSFHFFTKRRGNPLAAQCQWLVLCYPLKINQKSVSVSGECAHKLYCPMAVTEGQHGDRGNLGKWTRAGYPEVVFTQEPFRDSAMRRSYKHINPLSTNSHLF